MSEITVFSIPTSEAPTFLKFEPTLANMQKAVGGGLIQAMHSPWPQFPRLTMFVDEEGLLKGLKPNIGAIHILRESPRWKGSIVVGDAYVTAEEREGYRSLNPEEMMFLADWFPLIRAEIQELS